MVWVEVLCWEVIGGCELVLIFDRWVELGTGSVAALIGVFRMVVLTGSVGVEADEGVLGGSPVATKLCWSICRGDNVWFSPSRGICDDVSVNGEGLAGRDEICLNRPKTFFGASDSADSSHLGWLSHSRSSLLSNRKSFLPFLVYCTSWYTPFWLCIKHCRPSSLSTPSGCVMRTSRSGKVGCLPAGRTKRNGFSGKLSLMPKSSTCRRSVVKKEVESNVTGEGQKTSSVLGRALSRVEERLRLRQVPLVRPKLRNTSPIVRRDRRDSTWIRKDQVSSYLYYSRYTERFCY